MNCQGNFEEGLRIIFYDNRLVGKPQFARGRIQFRNTAEAKKDRTLHIMCVHGCRILNTNAQGYVVQMIFKFALKI